jgi:alkylhydroperoxidase family enzyme
MTWVETDPETEGLDHILVAHSLNPDSVRAHLALYRTVMFGRSRLSRAEREAIAVCASAANDCHY